MQPCDVTNCEATCTGDIISNNITNIIIDGGVLTVRKRSKDYFKFNKVPFSLPPIILLDQKEQVVKSNVTATLHSPQFVKQHRQET